MTKTFSDIADLREMIESKLKEKGYDGFFFSAECCACKIGDIAPCDNLENIIGNFAECEPGVLSKHPPCSAEEYAERGGDSDAEWFMIRKEDR